MGFGRGALLWLLGVPLPIIILLALFWHHWTSAERSTRGPKTSGGLSLRKQWGRHGQEYITLASRRSDTDHRFAASPWLGADMAETSHRRELLGPTIAVRL